MLLQYTDSTEIVLTSNLVASDNREVNKRLDFFVAQGSRLCLFTSWGSTETFPPLHCVTEIFFLRNGEFQRMQDDGKKSPG